MVSNLPSSVPSSGPALEDVASSRPSWEMEANQTSSRWWSNLHGMDGWRVFGSWNQTFWFDLWISGASTSKFGWSLEIQCLGSELPIPVSVAWCGVFRGRGRKNLNGSYEVHSLEANFHAIHVAWRAIYLALQLAHQADLLHIQKMKKLTEKALKVTKPKNTGSQQLVLNQLEPLIKWVGKIKPGLPPKSRSAERIPCLRTQCVGKGGLVWKPHSCVGEST